MSINPDFKDFALSYSGFEGGNLNAKYWFCGIENSPNKYSPIIQNSKSFKVADVWPEGFKPKNIQLDLKEAYYLRMAKIAYVIKTGEYPSCDDVKKYFISGEGKGKFFTKASDFNKLNLYPLAFTAVEGNNEWKSGKWDKLTGIQSKKEYYEWCNEHRAKALQKWIEKSKCAILICTGLSFTKPYFTNLFGAYDKNVKDMRIYTPAAIRKVKHIVEIPIYGSVKDKTLYDVGLKIRELGRGNG